MSLWVYVNFFWPPLLIYLLCLLLLTFGPKPIDGAVYIYDCSSYFEKFILLRTTKFKNAPSGTWYFVKAVGRTSLFCIFSLVLFFTFTSKFGERGVIKGVEHDPLTIAGTIVIVVVAFYWNERQSYVSKWEYLANLYNKMIESSSIQQREMYISSLAQDIHLTEMWGHKTFYHIFAYEIAEAKGSKVGECNLQLTDAEVEELLSKTHLKILKNLKDTLEDKRKEVVAVESQ